jgi:hypothetical protein
VGDRRDGNLPRRLLDQAVSAATKQAVESALVVGRLG